MTGRGRPQRHSANCGFAAAAIDAPGHGDRPRTTQDEQVPAYIKEGIAAGQAVGPEIARYNAELAVRAVPEWHTILDALQELALIGTRSHVGYWGISLGSATGVPYTASEPRIDAAVFGLAGDRALAEAAARVTVPVEFVLQWDDEIVPRGSALALFDAFGSREKSLHANPGPHAGVPRFEVESSERFFARHLR